MKTRLTTLTQRAKRYLRSELGGFSDLTLVRTYEYCPLYGPSDHALFSFTSSVGSDLPERHYVFSSKLGLTNFYPDWGVSLEDLWAIHVGLQFELGSNPKPWERAPSHDETENIRSRISAAEQENSYEIGETTIRELPDAAEFLPSVLAIGCCTVNGKRRLFVIGQSTTIVDGQHTPIIEWRRHIGKIIVERGGLDD